MMGEDAPKRPSFSTNRQAGGSSSKLSRGVDRTSSDEMPFPSPTGRATYSQSGSTLSDDGTNIKTDISKARNPLFSRRKQHSQPEWDGMKHVIEDLYMARNYPLPKVIEILSQDHGFEATQRMFKTQFKRWGFEKNLTGKRVSNLFRADTVKDGVRKVVDITRIEKYLKRKRPQDESPGERPHPDSIGKFTGRPLQPRKPSRDTIFMCQYLLGGSCPPEYTRSSVSIGLPDDPHKGVVYQNLGEDTTTSSLPWRQKRFRIEIRNPTSTFGAYLVVPSKHVYRADSWGRREFHDVGVRTCPPNCGCRRLEYKSHVFAVTVEIKSIRVRILSSRLRETVGRVASLTNVNDRFNASFEIYDGFALLKNYGRLKEHVSSQFLSTGVISTELDMLVSGLLEDGDIWHRFGFDELASAGVLDKKLMASFKHQRLMRGIQQLDDGFQDVADVNLEKQSSGQLGMYDDPEELLGTPTSTIMDNNSTGLNAPCQLEGAHPHEFYEVPTVDLSELTDDESLSGSQEALSPSGHPPLDLSLQHAVNIREGDTSSSSITEFDVNMEDYSTKGQGVSPPQVDLDTKLVAACDVGDIITVNTLCAIGANADALVVCEGRPRTPLIAAIENHHENIVRLLHSLGARTDRGSQSEVADGIVYGTPLHTAVQARSYRIAKLLLELGADVDMSYTIHRGTRMLRTTALVEAARSNQYDTFRLLLAWSTTFESSLKNVRLSLADGSFFARKTGELFLACSTGNTSGVIEALRTGASINAVSLHGTGLSQAIIKGKEHIVKLLLKHGADVQLAALYLVRSGSPELAKKLLSIAFGGEDHNHYFEKLRLRFTRQYKKIREICAGSGAANLGTFVEQQRTYRRAWSTGIAVMKKICHGDAPTEVSDTAAFLAVARALAETIAGVCGDFKLLDKFDDDLQRWQQLFPFEDDLLSYRNLALLAWGVDLTEICFHDTDSEDQATLERFRNLILTLIDGAQDQLTLDSRGSNLGLQSTLFRWLQRNAESTALPDGGILPLYPSDLPSDSRNYPPPWQLDVGGDERSAALDTGQQYANIRQKSLMSPSSSSASCNETTHSRDTSYSSGIDSVALFLVRGAIFSIVFIFLNGLQIPLWPQGLVWDRVGVGTLTDRMEILVRYFRPPSTPWDLCDLLSGDGPLAGDSSTTTHSSTRYEARSYLLDQKPNTWHSLLGMTGYWI